LAGSRFGVAALIFSDGRATSTTVNATNSSSSTLPASRGQPTV
jgi:hypothetical protein